MNPCVLELWKSCGDTRDGGWVTIHLLKPAQISRLGPVWRSKNGQEAQLGIEPGVSAIQSLLSGGQF